MLEFPWSHITSRQSLPLPLQTRLDDLGLVHPSTMTEQNNFANTVTKEEWSDSEKAVRAVLSGISKSKPASISQHMTIFQLGLDSINAVQVAALLRRAGFPGVTATDVLENPTCSSLAVKISAKQPTGGSSKDYDMAAFEQAAKVLLKDSISNWKSIEAVLPCTPLQVAMLTQFLNSDGKDYFNFISFRFEKNVSIAKIMKGLEELIESHPILRSGFVPINHQDASFVMIQYAIGKYKISINIHTEVSDFKLLDWQRAASQSALEKLHQSPWTVAIVPGCEGLEMHLAIHHAVYDALSLQNMMEKLEATFRDEPLDTGKGLVPVVREIMTEVQRCREEAPEFWKKLASEAVINKFPTMTPLRENRRSILVRQRSCTLSVQDFSVAAKEGGLTIQAVAQAAWLRILSSYIGEPTVIFGTVFSGRNSDATNEAAFPCITTLPVIIQHSSSNRALLQAMMEYNMGLQRHQRTPLTEIQKHLGHPNTRLFDTLLVYQKFNRSARKSKLWSVIHEEANVDYPVSMEIGPDQDSLQLHVTFFDDVLPVEQAEMLLKQFDVVLCDLVTHPDGCDEDILEDRPDLFAIIPASQPELISDTTLLHGFVEASAAEHSDKTALEFIWGFDDSGPISQRWSYKELDENGNRVANMLSSHVQPGNIVAIFFEKSPEAHFAMLGILKAGCALLSLDPGAPSSRNEFITKDSGASVLLTGKIRGMGLGFKVQIPVITIDQDSLRSMDFSRPALTRPLAPGDRSYCLYTSGTTGTPKGCEITHENAVQAMLAFQKLFEGHWDESSKWLQFASYHFDVSVLEQYWTWSVGITLVAAPRDYILEDLAGTISRLEITHIDLTPSLARLLHPEEVPSLCKGVFITGGEQLKQEILDVWGPKRVIHNFYGPTEATIGVTTYPCVPTNGRSSNIGRQFPNVGSYVLRPKTEIPVLRGGVGELCVSGKLVGKGYLNREELTVERFPCLSSFKERVYRTGDLVRVLHDGCFDFLGRSDDQVKLRGQRLEIGEINHCIRSAVLDITDVVTLVIRNESQQKELLVSFIVTSGEQAQEGKKLRPMTGDDAQRLSQRVKDACRNKLPGYMVPTYVLMLPFIPLSPNNKAEVKELKTLFNSLSHEQLVGPSRAANGDLGETGRNIYKALSRTFGVQEGDILLSTSTFELGVDSISVMRLTRALRVEGFSQATAAMVLKNPVVADLARALQSSQRTNETAIGVLEASQAIEACQHSHKGSVCRKLGIGSEDLEYVAPCSPLQHGMVSRSRAGGNEGAYFNTFRYRLADAVDSEKLRNAWQSLVQKHAILRTKFVSTTDGYVQVATKSQKVLWEAASLKSGDDLDLVLAERRKRWIENNSESIKTPLQFLELGFDHKRLLVVHIFHGIYDGHSFDLMTEEVTRLYNGDEQIQVNPPSFIDALLHGPLRNYSFCKEFWLKHLQDVKPKPLPQMSSIPSSENIRISRRIEFHSLDKVRRSLGVTQQAIIQAIWTSVLYQYCGSVVTFGIIVSGRSMELENVDVAIGPLFNTIPYHHGSPEGQTWASAIRTCHEFNTATLPFQHVPLRDVQKWCSGGASIFDALFSFQRASSAANTYSRLWNEIESVANPDYPIALEATLFPDESLNLLIVIQEGVADKAALGSMADEFETKARALVHDLNSLAFPDSVGHLINRPLEIWKDAGATHACPQLSSSTADLPSHKWSPQADMIRKEIMLLAGLEDSSITQSTTLLELGLDSIDAIKLSARLRRAGIRLSTSELIRGQNIARFIDILKTKEHKGDGIHDSGYSSDVENSSTSLKEHLMKHGQDLRDVERVMPPTPLQDSMVSEMVQSGFQRYFNHDVLKLGPQVEIKPLKDAWVTVVKNSPILRTVFTETVGTEFDFAYAQVVLKNCPLVFREIEVDSSEDLPSTMEQARIKAQAGQAQSDLLQVTFARSGHGSYMILSIAHALYDGWSLGLLHRDLESAYFGKYTTRPSYVEFLHGTIMSFKQEARDFWTDYVSGAAPVMFPSQGPRESGERVNRAEVLSAVGASALKEFCMRHAVSQQVVGQACWAAVLATRCKVLDVVFGVVLSGRDTEVAEEMLFPTMNTVPVRAVLHGSVSNFLRHMQDNMAGVGQFQHFPLRKIQALSKAYQGSLFNTLFIMQKNRTVTPETTGSGDEQVLMRSVESSSAVDYLVCVEMEASGQNVVWRIACDNGNLPADETNRLLEDIEHVLEYLINSADKDLLQFSGSGVSVCGLSKFQPHKTTMLVEKEPVVNQLGDLREDGGWSDAEESIRQVLAGMSGIEGTSIRKNHNLYHLGLDSISAIKVSSALRKQGIQLGVRDMIQATSISEMATKACKNTDSTSSVTAGGQSLIGPQILDGMSWDISLEELFQSAGLDASEAEAVLPATAMQTHMLSVWQNTHGAVFFPEFRYRLPGIPDRGEIESAWSRLVELTPTLRTIFLSTGRRPMPILQVVLRRQAENPFVLFKIQPDGAETWVLRLRIHHALYDGISLPLVMGRLKALLGKGTLSDSDEPTTALTSWGKFVSSPMDSRARASRESFWTAYLAGAQVVPWHLSSSKSIPNNERASILKRAAVSDTGRLKALCARNGISVQAAFLAAYAKVLSTLSGSDDVVFGVYMANRTADLELHYPTLCLVPLRVRIPRAFHIVEVSLAVQRDIFEISRPENVRVGLWEIKDWTGVVIDNFVNFLTLPNYDSSKGEDHDGVSLEAIHFGEAEMRSEGQSTAFDPRQMPWLEKNVVRDTYPVSTIFRPFVVCFGVLFI
jgi:ferricrocin synthase